MSYLDLLQNSATAEPDNTPVVFAATDMTTIIRNGCPGSQDTAIENGKCYRRLTPEYWAWFYHKYQLMEQALVKGKISEKTFVEILDRISTLYNQALALYGRDALKQAEATLDFNSWDEKIRKENAGMKPQAKHNSGVPRLVVGR